ncbi:MAG: hypothetical protein AAB611_00810 [Patescibacteria group bacterium]
MVDETEQNLTHNNRHQLVTAQNKMIYGRRLKPGEIIEPDDVYDSASGLWERAPCPGLTLGEGDSVVWVRPYKC